MKIKLEMEVPIRGSQQKTDVLKAVVEKLHEVGLEQHISHLIMED